MWTEVTAMTVADRIEPVYRPWVAPVVVADDETYVGKHRRPGRVSVSWRRMFYAARHRLRVR
jgi:hypothetical protein